MQLLLETAACMHLILHFWRWQAAAFVIASSQVSVPSSKTTGQLSPEAPSVEGFIPIYIIHWFTSVNWTMGAEYLMLLTSTH
jgi:hypothetical protein